MKKQAKSFDFMYFILVISLLSLGMIVMFSASSESARTEYNDVYFFLKRQMIAAGIGIFVMFFMANFNYKNLQVLALPSFLFCIFLLVLVLVIGTNTKGATRWLDLGFVSFQPSELLKISVILFFAQSLSVNGKMLKDFWRGLFPYLCVLGVVSLLLILQPHFSATVIIVLIGVSLLFLAGADLKHLIILGAGGLVGACLLIFTSEYRLKRLVSALDPFADKLGDGWQSVQSLYAIGSGGLFGLGLGRSRQKFLYIPEPHNDFVFSILCEELGFIGAFLVLTLFALLIYRGISIAMNAPNTFSSLTAMGITILIAIQVIINIAVVSALVPVTGMPLPFFSFGGTTLVINMAAMGIMLNISRYSKTGKV